MVEYFPSEDLPPPRYAFPPPTLVEDPEPPEVGTFPLGFGSQSFNEGQMGIPEIPSSRWERWRGWQNRLGYGRFSHQWAKDKMVVCTPYEQQAHPPGSCCYQLVEELNAYTPCGTMGSERNCDWRPFGYPKDRSLQSAFYFTKKTGGIRLILDLSFLNFFYFVLLC